MTFRWQVEPMARWPYSETRGRKANPFKANWSDTLELLERELSALNVKGVVAIRVVGEPGDIRMDGMLRATARLSHPGVAVSFQSKYGPLTYPCDTFVPNGYRGFKYTGWRAIEAPGSPGFASSDEALNWLRHVVHVPGVEGLSNGLLVRTARATAHPDRNGGDRSRWDRVEAARELLVKDGLL